MKGVRTHARGWRCSRPPRRGSSWQLRGLAQRGHDAVTRVSHLAGAPAACAGLAGCLPGWHPSLRRSHRCLQARTALRWVYACGWPGRSATAAYLPRGRTAVYDHVWEAEGRCGAEVGAGRRSVQDRRRAHVAHCHGLQLHRRPARLARKESWTQQAQDPRRSSFRKGDCVRLGDSTG